MTRIKRALVRLYDKCAQLILWNVGVDKAVQYAGPLAALYWPQTPSDRWEIYEQLRMDIDVAMDRQLDYAKRMDSLVKILEVLAKLQMPFDKELLGQLLVKYLDLGVEGQALIKTDPNDLIGRLAEALQKDPSAIAPDALMILAQLGQMAGQAVIAQAGQTAAASGMQPVGPTGPIAAPAAPPRSSVPNPEAPATDVAGKPQL